jgi:MFS family permease
LVYIGFCATHYGHCHIFWETGREEKMIKGYLNRLRNAFGVKFIVLIFIAQCLIKGVTFVIMTEGILPIFRYMGLDGIQVQVYGAIAMSPWTIKPLVGIFSDLVSIVGYHKKYIMFFSCLLGITGCIIMVVEIYIPVVVVIFVCLVHFQIATLDVLIEGKYAELMRQHPDTGSDVVTMASGFQRLGFIIALCFVGPFADLGLFRFSNIIALILCCFPLLPILFNWLPEVPKINVPYIQVDTKRIKKDWKIITVVLMTGISAPATGAVSALAMKWLGLVCAAVVVIVVIIGGFLSMPNNIIARVALYQVLIQSSKISYNSILTYFFIADSTCLPGGPNFSYKFYITITGLAGAAASLVTVFIYQWLFSKWKFRNVLIFTAFLSAFGGMFDFIILKRWNLDWGIPDTVFFLIGDDVFTSIIETLYYIPSSAIIGKVCPKNMEASTYAYLAGIANFGLMISAIAGAMLAEMFNVKTIGPDCNWENLPMLVLIGHVCLPVVVSVVASFLIPNVPQDSDLLATKEEEAEKEVESLVTMPDIKEDIF